MILVFTSKSSRLEEEIRRRFSPSLQNDENETSILVKSGKDTLSFSSTGAFDILVTDSQKIDEIVLNTKVNSIVSCGTSLIDSVTFSSITEDTFVVCIRRKIILTNKLLEPLEFVYPFDRRLGIYENLVLALMSKILA